ncbi:uncharacterized transporter HI_0519-like [Pecten maximus]|uniref:uncharacterized transporter HI_0519-like n=1 Tax=Pecten maximus TaxID=6579 RepID=UPI0014581281|nr:uncharacterized transporter HI_0519-like [Pecten maximus]
MDTDLSSSGLNTVNNEAKQETSLTDRHSVGRIQPSEDVLQTTEISSEPEIVVLEPKIRGNDQDISNKKDSFLIDKLFHRIRDAVSEYKKLIKQIVWSLLLLLYLAYVVYSLSFRFGDEGAWRLLICTILLVVYLGWGIIKTLSMYQSFKNSLGSKNPENITKVKKLIRWALYFVVLALIAVYLGLTVVQTRPRNLISCGGMFVFIFILFLMSNSKANIKWHTVFWGLSLQFGFALVILRTEWGIGAVRWVTDRFMEFIAFFDNGSAFVFSEKYKEFKVIFKVVPSVIVFCAVIGGLSYIGVLAFIVSNFGGFLGYCLQTNPVESINAAINIFLSGTESLMFISEYIDTLSTSHLFCVYTNGVSSIAGIALIVFSNFGIPIEYLMTASIMSAPAALVASKIIYPSEMSEDEDKRYTVGTKAGPKSLAGALTTGGLQGLQIVKKVLINLLIYISLFAFVNAAITWFGDRAGVESLTLGKIFSYVFWPLAFIMGIDAVDCLKVAEMFGVRMFATLFLSYIQLAKYFKNKDKYNEYTALYNNTVLASSGDIFLPNWNTTLENGILTDRSELITTYGMCGFASIPSVVILLSSFATIAPNRHSELTKMTIRALTAGTLATFLTGNTVCLKYPDRFVHG